MTIKRKAPLKLDDQLYILKEARVIFLKSDRQRQLCFCIRDALCSYLRLSYIQVDYNELHQYIPLFTNKNAIKYSNGIKNAYWFRNYWDREQFLEWMINTLTTQINKRNDRQLIIHDD